MNHGRGYTGQLEESWEEIGPIEELWEEIGQLEEACEKINRSIRGSMEGDRWVN